jgi:putative oxidoreductase
MKWLRLLVSVDPSPRQIDIALFVLRALPSLMLIILHGGKKIMHWSTEVQTFDDPFGMGHLMSLLLALGAEVGCSSLVLLGLFTRLAAAPIIFTLLMVFVVRNGGDAEADPQLACIYAVAFVTIAIAGPGRFSADARLQRWLDERRPLVAAESGGTS